MEIKQFNFPKGGALLIPIVVFIIIIILRSAHTIGPGEAGVLFERFGDGINTEENLW